MPSSDSKLEAFVICQRKTAKSWRSSGISMDLLKATKLSYFDDMWKLHSKASLISCIQGEDGRRALILDSTIFHPQGGGQPADTGFITHAATDFKFIVQDTRLKDELVFHYGFFENPGNDGDPEFPIGQEVCLYVDEARRNLNSRLHSAGHLLDVCVRNVGWDHLQPGKAYHFPDGPFVEYKGAVPQNEIQSKQKELEMEASALISRGGRISAAVLSYEKACELCGGSLPDYIPKESSPRIVKLGENLGCPCGGTHVVDISEIGSLKVGQIRTKKGVTKVSYTVD
ncbi:alanine--tRNA ligase [Telopea speciosissima]|uniref:alanine--tRNA ligase n=1 Tax=Telopea speciosissima TaxID=54955 RepID=UPI001CC7C5EA|nr:alanine--tRNA ligase [Telopea speciosissima]